MYGEEKANEIAQRLWSIDAEAVEYLPGGLINSNFKVTAKDGSRYVVRIFGQQSELMPINREAEVAATTIAASLGIGPSVIADLRDEGALVIEFIDGAPIGREKMNTPEVLPRVAAALRKLHAGPPFIGELNFFQMLGGFYELAQSTGDGVDVEAAEAIEWAFSIVERIEKVVGFEATSPCHCDLLPGNFLDDGNIRILDWEVACMSDPRVDLASLSMNHRFSVEDDRNLVRYYLGTSDEHLVAAIRLLSFVIALGEAIFGLLQQNISGLDFDFGTYHKEYVERLRRMAEDPQFEQWFDLLQAKPTSGTMDK